MKIRSKSEPQLSSPLISFILQVASRDRARDGLERQLTTTRLGFSTHELLAGHALSAVGAYGGLVGAYIRNANVLGKHASSWCPRFKRAPSRCTPTHLHTVFPPPAPGPRTESRTRPELEVYEAAGGPLLPPPRLHFPLSFRPFVDRRYSTRLGPT